VKQGWVGRIGQWGGTIHRILDRLANGRIAIALRYARVGHFTARNLGDFDPTIDAGTR
jgi:hypothetical protein